MQSAGWKRMGADPPHEAVQGATGHDLFGTSGGTRALPYG